jgi:hypothetical protein
MDDTREVCPKRSLNRQADAKAGTDQALDAFPANIMSHHFWPVYWRGKSGDNHVMNLMSGITVAQQKPFALEVGPVNDLNANKLPRCAVPRGAARFATALAGAGDAPSAWLSGYTRGRKAGKKRAIALCVPKTLSELMT